MPAKYYIPLTLLAALLSAGVILGVIKLDSVNKERVHKAETERAKRIDAALADCEREGVSNKSERLIESVQNIDDSDLSKAQIFRKLILLGDIYLFFYNDVKRKGDRQYYFDMAVKYFNRAQDYTDSEEQKSKLKRGVAKLYFSNREWKKALDLFNQAGASVMAPEERWRANVDKAECLERLGETKEAASLLSQVADESDNSEIWGDAVRRKADIYLKASENPEEAAALTGDKSSSPEELSKKLRDTAATLYQSVIKDLPTINPDVSAANLGLLDLLTAAGDRQEAYKMANKIQASPSPIKDKARALMLLGRLEEKTGNTKAAEEIYETCLKRFPGNPLSVPISMTLYELHSKNEAWEKAFNILESLFFNNPTPETIAKLLKLFTHGENRLLSVISSSEGKEGYIKRASFMLDWLQSNHPNIWAEVRNDAQYVMAELLYLSKKYDEAEKAIVTALNTPKNTVELTRKLCKLDIQCAVKANRSPAIRIARARRYLAKFPDGDFYREALLCMLDSYYDMELYDAALAVSKKIYVDMLNSSKKEKGGHFDQTVWLKTVARIGQCYEKLGQYDKSNRILKEYASRLVSYPFAAAVFLDWSKTAEEKGQVPEAVRRLELIIPRVTDPDQRASLIVARYILLLKRDNDGEYYKASAFLDKMSANKAMTPALRTELRRSLVECLLEYSLKHGMKTEFNRLVDKASREFKDESWPEYWILRSLSPLFDISRMGELEKRHSEILSTLNAANNDGKETAGFLREQMRLINGLVGLESRFVKLKNERKVDERPDKSN